MDPKSVQLTSFSDLIDKYDNFIFDCDGVIWKGESAVENAFETLNQLKDLKKKVFFVTNNSAKSRHQYLEKLSHLGFNSEPESMYPLSYVGPLYVKTKYPEVKKIYTMGMQGLFDEIKEAGFEAVGGSHENTRALVDEEEFKNLVIDEDIHAVILGFDMGFNYYKMSYASLCIQSGAHFFAISDEPYDIVGGKKFPGGGAAVTALERACGVSPIFLGKPNKHIIDLILEQNGLDAKRTLMTGDRINVDVLLGKNGGVDTCLVLTGVTTREMADGEFTRENPVIPDYMCQDLCTDPTRNI